MLLYYDIRQLSKNPKPIWSLQAHDESITAFDISPTVAGLVVTGSNDKRVKLWKVQESGPTLTVTRDLQVGKVFATKFAPDADMGFRLSVAGSQGNMQVWDTSTNAAVRHAFAGKTKAANGTGREDRIVAVAADEDEDSEREGELVVIRDGEEGIDEDMDEGEDDWVSEQEEP